MTRNKPSRVRRDPSEICNPHSEILLGAHMSIGGGVHRAIERSRSIKCTAMQIFVKNNMQWFARPLQRQEISALSEELVRADHLELPFLVLHPGAHLGAGEEAGLAKIVESIDRVLAGLPKTKTRIALETTAGQGSCLGHRFEHLAHIIANVREPERLCVCLDSAHVFAAGYDLATEKLTKRMFAEFDRLIGLERLVALHLNDSKTARGSRVDRHEHIGKGQIGLEAFRFIMRDRRFRKIPKVLETPKGKELKEDVENMQTLRSLL